jgi:biopolymer transport protein ExbD
MAVQLNRGSSLAPFNLTPMIDCVFHLLIFFLAAAELSEEEREMKVLLPEASEAMPLTSKPREVFINIDQAGRYYVTGELLTLEDLAAVLKTAWTNNPGRASVVIRADRRCQWQFVVGAMDACNKARIRDYRVTSLEGQPG